MIYPYIMISYLHFRNITQYRFICHFQRNNFQFLRRLTQRSEGTVDTSSERLITGTPDLDIGSCFLLELHPNNTNTPISNKDMCFIATIELRFIVCA